MISRANSGTNICLRCQIRISGALASPKSPLLPRRLLREVRLQHDEARSKTPEAADLNPGAHHFPQNQPNGCRRDHGLPLEESSTSKPIKWFKVGRNQLSRYPLGRLHGVRGHQKREDAVELDIDSLGTPSEVIVLRDSRVRAIPSIIEDAETPDQVDLLAQLDSERGLISRAEVKANIELLRPKDDKKVVSWIKLREIQEHLFRGFTVAQLVEYVHSFDGQCKAEDLSSIRRRTSWMAGISGPGENFEESYHRGYGSESLTRKQRLVLLLLRQCWGLEAQEVIESIGEIELKLRDTELAFLTSGYITPLQRIRDQLIFNREEKIETFQSRGVVRITAPKEKCETVGDQILKIVQDTQHQEVSLNTLFSRWQNKTAECKALKDSVLDQLARLTETEIKWLPKSEEPKLFISYINQNPGTLLSTPADVAQRLLLTSSDLADRTTTIYGYTHISPPLLATKYHSTDGMSWRNKIRNWLRWTCPMPKSLPAVINDKAETASLIYKNVPEISEGVNGRHGPSSAWSSEFKESKTEQQDPLQEVSESAFWDRNCVTSTSAIVGHVLHAVPTIQEATIKNLELAIPERAIFKAATVNLSRFISIMKQQTSSPPASLIMRFMPSPWTAEGSAALAKFPQMEMIFAVDTETKEPTLEKIVAVVDSHASDLMLLNSSLDLRFQQRSTACLSPSSYQQLPQIKDFVEASNLSIRHGQLETPSGLSLPVSAHLCRVDASKPSIHPPAGSLDVDYLFAGLEYRTTVALNFEGWDLRYTSIEGGKADGRRGELSLLPNRLPEGRVKEQDRLEGNQTEQYVNAAYRLINRLEKFNNPALAQVLSTNPGKLIKPLQRSQDSGLQLFKRPIDFGGWSSPPK